MKERLKIGIDQEIKSGTKVKNIITAIEKLIVPFRIITWRLQKIKRRLEN